MNILFTDYPFTDLGDEAGKEAPIRAVKAISFDGDKYVKVLVEDTYQEIKAGYIYTVYGRCGKAPVFDPSELSINNGDSNNG